MSKALLICNGEKPGVWLKKLAKRADFIIAADGGAEAAVELGMMPDVVLGDLDSISPRTRRKLKNISLIEVKRQDNTDLEKALDWLLRQGFTHVTIVGATGGRLDFTIGNLLAVRPYLSKLDICFCGENWALYPCISGDTLPARPGARLSIIPISVCRAVSLTGCRYPLNRQHIGQKYIGHTLSNQVTKSKISLTFASGFLLLYLENKPSKKRI